jgi:hypothetical protein
MRAKEPAAWNGSERVWQAAHAMLVNIGSTHLGRPCANHSHMQVGGCPPYAGDVALVGILAKLLQHEGLAEESSRLQQCKSPLDEFLEVLQCACKCSAAASRGAFAVLASLDRHDGPAVQLNYSAALSSASLLL